MRVYPEPYEIYCTYGGKHVMTYPRNFPTDLLIFIHAYRYMCSLFTTRFAVGISRVYQQNVALFQASERSPTKLA